MDRALRGINLVLLLMFVFFSWGILTTSGGLLVKLIMFFMLTVAALGVTLVLTTESPLADAVLKAPWEESEGSDAPEAEGTASGTGEEAPAPARSRPRAAARAGAARQPRTRAAAEAGAAGPAGESSNLPAGGPDA